jgi:hypothetical protein
MGDECFDECQAGPIAVGVRHRNVVPSRLRNRDHTMVAAVEGLPMIALVLRRAPRASPATRDDASRPVGGIVTAGARADSPWSPGRTPVQVVAEGGLGVPVGRGTGGARLMTAHKLRKRAEARSGAAHSGQTGWPRSTNVIAPRAHDRHHPGARIGQSAVRASQSPPGKVATGRATLHPLTSGSFAGRDSSFHGPPLAGGARHPRQVSQSTCNRRTGSSVPTLRLWGGRAPSLVARFG